MDGNKLKFFKKHQSSQFKRKGVGKKGRWNNSSGQHSPGIYRILCPSRKNGGGGVIGKGGGLVKVPRQETYAKITVAESVPGSNERVIIIYSSPEKIWRKQDNDEDLAAENEEEQMEPHCAAQDALLKVHERIVEEDLFGGMVPDDDENNVVTVRLLVPDNIVGCLLGKCGDVIQRLQGGTGASIRVLPADHLPTCAMSTDELVQISGKPDVAKRALCEVSTLLHQKPRKDKHLNVLVPYCGQGLHSPGGHITKVLPPGNPLWAHPNSASCIMPPMPWSEGMAISLQDFCPAALILFLPDMVGNLQLSFLWRFFVLLTKLVV